MALVTTKINIRCKQFAIKSKLPITDIVWEEFQNFHNGKSAT